MKFPLSWQLWRLLRNPPFMHPLFRRTLLKPLYSADKQVGRVVPDARFVVEMLAGLFICSAMFSPALVFVLIGGLFLILNGTGYSLLWSIRASGIIGTERERGSYDLYSVTPEGEAGVNWAIMTGCLHRNRRFDQVHSLVVSLLAMAGIVLLLILFIITIGVGQRQSVPGAHPYETRRALITLIHSTTIIALVYVDHVHSIVLGCLVSMLVPTYTRGRVDAQIGTAGLYLMLQVTAYLAAYLIGLELLPTLYREANEWAAPISLAGLQVMVFYSVREGMIVLLWNKLAERLNLNESSTVFG